MAEAKIQKRRRVLWAVLTMAVGALVLIVMYAVLTSATKSTAIRETQQTNSPLIEKIEKQSRQIKRLTKDVRSCVRVGGECYERGQAQTKDAVGSINEVVILAASCASGPVQRSVEEIASCVTERLADKP